MPDVRVLAFRLNGDGTETLLSGEVPLSGITLTPALNSGMVITGKIEPAYLSQIGPDGRPIIEGWSTAIYVEEDGDIIGGGIVAEDSFDFMSRTLTTVGFADYPANQPYTDSWVSTALDQAKQREVIYPGERAVLATALADAVSKHNAAVAAHASASGSTKKKREQEMANAKTALDAAQAKVTEIDGIHAADVEMLATHSHPQTPTFTDGQEGVDPIDIFRHIWIHLQSKPMGDLGVVLDNTTSPARIGESIAAVEYDDDNDGDTPEFEYAEFRLAWYETTDLGSKITELADGTPFNFWEEHSWNDDRTAIEHRIRIAYPIAGRQRRDIRLTIGENVEIPQYANTGSGEYASELLALGAGEERARVNAIIHRDGETRIRRVKVFDDVSRASPETLAAAARTQLVQHDGYYSLSSLKTIPGFSESLSTIRLGDHVLVVGDLGWHEIAGWYKVTAISHTVDGDDTIGLTVERVDRGSKKQ